MKFKMACLGILAALLVVVLCSCSASKKVTKTESGPTQTAMTQPRAMPADTGKSTRSAPAENVKETMISLKDVHFDFDRYVIRPADEEILKQDYLWFKANPASHVTVEGNCDERGSIEYNLALGQKRADAARSFLVTLGVQPNMLKTISYGKEKPIDPGHDEEAWAKNRRTHLESEK